MLGEERPAGGFHVHDEFGVVTVDLHDLNASLAKRAEGRDRMLRATQGDDLITGRGRHLGALF